MQRMTRRMAIKTGVAGVWVAAFPSIIPARVLGQEAPSKTIQVGQIGFGRIAKGMLSLIHISEPTRPY